LQNSITDPDNVDFVVTTDVCSVSNVKAFCKDIEEQSFVKEPPTLLVWLRK